MPAPRPGVSGGGAGWGAAGGWAPGLRFAARHKHVQHRAEPSNARGLQQGACLHALLHDPPGKRLPRSLQLARRRTCITTVGLSRHLAGIPTGPRLANWRAQRSPGSSPLRWPTMRPARRGASRPCRQGTPPRTLCRTRWRAVRPCWVRSRVPLKPLPRFVFLGRGVDGYSCAGGRFSSAAACCPAQYPSLLVGRAAQLSTTCLYLPPHTPPTHSPTLTQPLAAARVVQL